MMWMRTRTKKNFNDIEKKKPNLSYQNTTGLNRPTTQNDQWLAYYQGYFHGVVGERFIEIEIHTFIRLNQRQPLKLF